MKVRIDQYSIRFRLNDEEWASLLAECRFAQSTRLPDSEAPALTYNIEHHPELSATEVSWRDAELTVKIAPDEWMQISGTSRDSMKCTFPAKGGDSPPLDLIVEKDIIVTRKRTQRNTDDMINKTEKQAI